eukprot:c5479_g1_i1.p1 GENE.c5479_g1_i1~~c5479_g1_i1.p1  ORF type:complete len:363 (+),score=74.66 c5479_g1_i1:58-1146(+)
MVFDFRSDTVTKPTQPMLNAMMTAEVGDDVYGDDETIKALEKRTAELFGKESGLFVASGTMSNQLAMRVHLSTLDEVVCDIRSHINVWECGGVHANCGAAMNAILPAPGQEFLTADIIEFNITSSHNLYHSPITRLVSLENTLHGAVYPIEEIAKISELCKRRGLRLHLDGARIWNAHVKSGVSFATYGQYFDTISVCFSKSMGCPVGSVLLGSQQLIDRAKHFRKLHGGGWRQAGLLAAAGLYALDNNISRLEEDHQNAQFLADGLKALDFTIVRPVETNMVWCALPKAFQNPNKVDMWAKVLQSLKQEEQVIVSGVGGDNVRNRNGSGFGDIRFVTHLNVPRQGVEKLLSGLARCLKTVA